ncbi:VOC family protein [Sinomicrobium sp. M5D2P9]
MKNNTSIRRIVPNIYSDNLEKSKQFYTRFLEMELVMDMGWILTFASKENPTAQISVFENTKKETLNNTAIFLSIEVSDVDQLYERAKNQGWEIVYPITDEPWGVRRFFVKDPNGATINILEHL